MLYIAYTYKKEDCNCKYPSDFSQMEVLREIVESYNETMKNYR